MKARIPLLFLLICLVSASAAAAQQEDLDAVASEWHAFLGPTFCVSDQLSLDLLAVGRTGESLLPLWLLEVGVIRVGFTATPLLLDRGFALNQNLTAYLTVGVEQTTSESGGAWRPYWEVGLLFVTAADRLALPIDVYVQMGSGHPNIVNIGAGILF